MASVLPWFAVGVLAYLGLAALTRLDWMLSQYVLAAIFLASGVLGTAYTLYAWRAGHLSMVSPSTGTSYLVDRRQSPVSFYFQAGLYLVFGVFMTGLGLWFALA